jgi:hypothetical protein
MILVGQKIIRDGSPRGVVNRWVRECVRWAGTKPEQEARSRNGNIMYLNKMVFCVNTIGTPVASPTHTLLKENETE